MVQEPVKIPPPSGDLSEAPDSDTKKAPDFTGPHADNRILHIVTPFFRYGTDDKTHAGSIVLSFAILVFVVIIAIIGAIAGASADSWMDKLVSWAGSAFLLVAGVAIGRSAGIKSKKDD